MERRCGFAAKTSWDSRWSSGSKRSNSWKALLTWVPGKAVTTKITNSMVTACPFDGELPKEKKVMINNPEKDRLAEHQTGKANWHRWGPYLSERAWGTVRED